VTAINRSAPENTIAAVSEADEVPEGEQRLGDAVEDIAGTKGDSVASDVEPSNESTNSTGAPTDRRSFRSRWTVRNQVVVAGVAVVIALSGLVGWLGYRAHESRQAAAETAQFVEVGRQGALNLTTIDWEHADADVERILASASGTFYDDFAQRSQPFIEVVKQTKSKSVGMITEAGLESASGDHAQVLVAVNVKTTLQGSPEVAPRSWRMRIAVQKQGDEMKVSNVEFVP
jgi:Mce-associated membrane protein